jgi:hypothetical protein
MDQGWLRGPLPLDALRRACETVSRVEAPSAGQGACSFPGCQAGGGFNPCTGYLGTANECLNCKHPWSYHY